MSEAKRKRFGISQNLNRGFSETIQAAENNVGAVRFEVVNLSRVEVDPENPRTMTVTVEDIQSGRIKASSTNLPKEEVESLERLANTISKKGLINPVVVYKHQEKYRLVAGERRFLASLIAGKEDIQVRVLNEKPKPVELRLLQWIENNEREDLSLKDRMGNIQAILKEHKSANPGVEVTGTLLKELIGISLPQATCYMAVLNAPSDLQQHIDNGSINNLDKAAAIAKIQPTELRKKALEACINGGSLKQIKSLIGSEQKPSKDIIVSNIKKRGRVAQRINMGATAKIHVVKKIITVMLEQPEYKTFAKGFSNVDWKEYGQVTSAFRNLIELLEKESGKMK